MSACCCGCGKKNHSRMKSIFWAVLNLVFALLFTDAALHHASQSVGVEILTWLTTAIFWISAVIWTVRVFRASRQG